jgi:uncharacterized protein involved in type VI secretion and phage assembly
MDDVVRNLAQDAETKFFGKYRGFVVDNKDPEQRARVKLKAPSVLGTAETDWALPCVPFGGLQDHGFFMVPEVNAQIWVEFEEGNLTQPIWTGTFWQQQGDPPAETAVEEPTVRLIKTPSGHLLQFEDKSGEETVTLRHASEAQLLIDKNGTIAITDKSGAKLTLDADGNKILVEDTNGNKLTMSSSGTTVEDCNGNKVEMAAAGVTVKGQQIVVEGQQVMLGGQGGEPVIKGQSFLSLFMTHMHPHPFGPTGPPVPQGEMSSLSMKVMTS